MSVPQWAHPQAISHILCEFFLRSCLLNIRHRLCVMLCIFWFRCLKQLPQESIWPQEASWSEVKKKLWELFLKKIFLNNKVIILCFFFFLSSGKKNFLPPSYLIMGFGFLFKVIIKYFAFVQFSSPFMLYMLLFITHFWWFLVFSGPQTKSQCFCFPSCPLCRWMKWVCSDTRGRERWRLWRKIWRMRSPELLNCWRTERSS